MLTIMETEKRTDIKKFFISLLKDFFKSGKSKHHLYGDSVIETLLSGFYLQVLLFVLSLRVVNGTSLLSIIVF